MREKEDALQTWAGSSHLQLDQLDATSTPAEQGWGRVDGGVNTCNGALFLH